MTTKERKETDDGLTEVRTTADTKTETKTETESGALRNNAAVDSGAPKSGKTSRSTKGRPRAFDRRTALVEALRVFWRLGYEPASVAILCKTMGINPPSFYAAFGSKAELFIEAVNYYEAAYWSEPLRNLERYGKGSVFEAFESFFDESAEILLNPSNPSGCMVVLAAVNISPDESEISALVRRLRIETCAVFERRLRRAVEEGELSKETDVKALADFINIFLEGMSIQAKDGMDLATLKRAVRPLHAALRAASSK